MPWHEAPSRPASYLGLKTVLNEFVAYAEFGHIDQLSEQTVVIVTFALAGFANFASIAARFARSHPR